MTDTIMIAILSVSLLIVSALWLTEREELRNLKEALNQKKETK